MYGHRRRGNRWRYGRFAGLRPCSLRAPGDPEHAACVARPRQESGPRFGGSVGKCSDLPDAERRHGQAQAVCAGRLYSGQRAVPPFPQAEPVLPALRHHRRLRLGREVLADRSGSPRHAGRAAQPLRRGQRQRREGRGSLRRLDQPLPAQRPYGSGADRRPQRSGRRGGVGARSVGSGHDAGNRPSGDTEAGAARGRLPERFAVLGVLRRNARHQRAAVRRPHPAVCALRLRRLAVPFRL